MERLLILQIAACIMLATVIGTVAICLMPIWIPVLLVDPGITKGFQEYVTKRGIRMMMSSAKGR